METNQQLVILVVGIGAIVVVAVSVAIMLLVRRQQPAVEPMPVRPDILPATHPSAVLQISGIPGGPLEQPLPIRQALTIGRDQSNDLRIDHHLVSRRHARVVGDAQGWQVEDLNSSNGTFLNGRPVQLARIKHGDMIEVGPARMLVNSGSVPESLPPAASAPLALAPADDSASGRFYGRYQVVRMIGEGGFGKIYLAQDGRDGRLAALKVLVTDDDYLNTKFRQEGALKLDHPHIARIFETGRADNLPFIAMEYVDGITLRKFMQRMVQPLDIALPIVGQVLAALDYAHRHKVIHRDIKPENIMIARCGGVKVIDFGIARVLSNVTRTQDGMMIGTPQYLSYEQASGQPVVPASDLYSTAIVLYQMLSGVLPFQAEKPLQIIRMHLTVQPRPLRELNPDIPPHIDAAVMRALSKQATQRFTHAAEFASALGIAGIPTIPPSVLADVARRALPITNEMSNAGQLPTRAPNELASSTIPVLRVESGPRRGQTIDVSASRAVGRLDIDPSDGTISRRHLVIERSVNGFSLVDGSTFGTTVNGQRVVTGQPHPLQHGTQIQVGQTILTFLAQPDR